MVGAYKDWMSRQKRTRILGHEQGLLLRRLGGPTEGLPVKMELSLRTAIKSFDIKAGSLAVGISAGLDLGNHDKEGPEVRLPFQRIDESLEGFPAEETRFSCTMDAGNQLDGGNAPV